jgi:hypothetical protein
MSLTRRALCLSALGLVLAPTLAKAGPKRLIDMRGRVQGRAVRGSLYYLADKTAYRFVLYEGERARYVDLRPSPKDLSHHGLLTQPGRFRFSADGRSIEMLVTDKGVFRLRAAGDDEDGGATVTFALAPGVLWAAGGLAFAGLAITGLAAAVYVETGKTPTQLLEDVTNAVTDAIDSGDVPTSYGDG